MKTCVFVIMVSITLTHGLPYNPSNTLNSNSAVGSQGHAASDATATGPGSTVGISGIVSGDSTTSIGVQSAPNSGPTSSISTQSNCSEFSSSNASGSEGASAGATGGCLSDTDNSGSHQRGAKVEIGIESQVGGQGGQTNTSSNSDGTQTTIQEAQIAQSSSQNQAEGNADAYVFLSGPQATSQFSGILNQAASHADHSISAGTSETVMSHTMGGTVIESIFEPLTPAKKD